MYRLRVKAPPEDSNAGDDQQEVDVEIVDRKTKVLLVASGPTREYIFLAQLNCAATRSRRRRLAAVGRPRAFRRTPTRFWTSFPRRRRSCSSTTASWPSIPIGKLLTPSEVDLLERWVAEKAGGLIVLAGPVEMDRWVQDPKLAKIRALYPVEFNRRLSLLEEGRFGSTTPWPVEFTREGLEAEFLWLADNAPSSQQIWTSFPGVFGYYGVRGAKPGATVYARYSDPEAGSGERAPVYMAGQFYGAGRVFYLGSGEMWRLRALDDSYFEQFYTKLIRHVSQGRLLLGSSRGMLLVDRDRYLLGNTVVVRAQLSDAQFEPLDLPSVPLQDRAARQHERRLATGGRPGPQGDVRRAVHRLAGRHLPAGDWTCPTARTNSSLARIQVKVPDLERENPERNDALLSEIASRTGGPVLRRRRCRAGRPRRAAAGQPVRRPHRE